MTTRLTHKQNAAKRRRKTAAEYRRIRKYREWLKEQQLSMDWANSGRQSEWRNEPDKNAIS